MAIQNRRGVYSDFTPSKMVPGELAVVQSGDPNNSSGKAVYAAFGSSGDVKRLATEDDLSGKVDKVTGKWLSTNDYTDAEKTKLAGIATGAEVNVQSDWNQSNTSADDFIKNKPTKTSDFTNDGDGTSNFATESYVQQNGGKIDTISVNGTQQTITNKNVDIPVPVIDSTLTQTGKAADSKVVGDELADLKNDLINTITAEWEQGGINITTGAKTTAANRCRTKEFFIPKDGTFTIVPNGFNYNFGRYKLNGDFEPYSGSWQTENTAKTFTLAYDANIVVQVRKSSSNEDITPSDVPTVVSYENHIVQELRSDINRIEEILDSGNASGINWKRYLETASATGYRYKSMPLMSNGNTVIAFNTATNTQQYDIVYYASYEAAKAGYDAEYGVSTYESASGWITNSTYTVPASIFIIVLRSTTISLNSGDLLACNVSNWINPDSPSVSALPSVYGTNAYFKVIDHRGARKYAPENTIPAFVLAKAYGFTAIETDVHFTSDDVPVLIHDDTINRTARNSDGTAISGDVYVENSTYTELENYDYGSWFSPEFQGTTIPTWEECIDVCKKLGLDIYLEVKGTITSAQAETLIDMAKVHNMSDAVTYFSGTAEAVATIVTADDSVNVGYLASNFTATTKNVLQGLITSANKVTCFTYIDSGESISDEFIDFCIENGIEMIYTKDVDTLGTVNAINPYAIGIITNGFNANYERYKALLASI